MTSSISRSPARRLRRGTVYIPLILIAAAIVLPLLWIVLTSFKTEFNTIQQPSNPVPDPFTLDAYGRLFAGDLPIFRWFLNSLAAATIETSLVLVTASAGAYALARLEFPGKKIVLGAIITTLLVPPVIFLIPNYLIVQNLGWLDTLSAISIPGAASAFGIFFLRQFFLNLPVEVEEAARIDGAGELRIYLQVLLPLARPALATLAVLTFLTNWNDFLWPVYVLLTPENFTLQPGLAILRSSYGSNFGVVMAGAVITAVPVLIIYVLAQRQIVEGVTAGGIKG